MAIKIFIDQGHNPHTVNAGAEGFGVREQDITYNVGIYLRDFLNADPRFEARTSRNTPDEILETNTNTSLAARVNAANSWPANYFISIHCNANVNPAINGTEGYVYQFNTQGHWLAQHIVQAIVDYVGTKYNGIRTANFYVLRNTTMPSTLIELAYITNWEDNRLLVNNQYDFAYAMYQGILRYFGFS
jgi:N-acetylmuramoyl-L-alanine amidase